MIEYRRFYLYTKENPVTEKRKNELLVQLLESLHPSEAKIVENMPGKMLKISIGTFLDEESAEKELTRIHKKINKDAWIARVKPSKNPK